MSTNTAPDLSKLDLDEVLHACNQSIFDLTNPGFCTACGAETDGVEPDAQRYPCPECGEHAVYGAEELLLYF